MQDLHTALQQLQQAQAAADAPEAQSQGGHSQPQAASVPEEAQPEVGSITNMDLATAVTGSYSIFAFSGACQAPV